MAISEKSADFLIRSRLADAAARRCRCALRTRRDLSRPDAGGMPVDLIEAHKWFNLAALSGDTRGQHCRAEISFEMTRPRDRRGAAPGAGMAGADRHPALRRLSCLQRIPGHRHRAAVLRPGFLVGAGRDRAFLAPADDQQAIRRNPLRRPGNRGPHWPGARPAPYYIRACRARRHGPRSRRARGVGEQPVRLRGQGRLRRIRRG